ncbi:MAG TPA: PilN domain-containing protein [Baekduia sp.]|nr:PilN domain-containing protein [Baekduia sp.]
MRAVNLIPTDQQRGAGGAAGRSGGAAYVLLGALALMVVMAAAYVVSGKSVDDKKAELARVTQEAAAAEGKAASLTSYTKFAAIRAKRVDTVTQLAASRFDWAHALREVSRVLPENAWLTQLTATRSSSVSVGGAGGTLRSALDVPAIQVQGCTTSQASVAKLIARLRLIDGVQRVSLEDSTKGAVTPKTAGTSAGASAIGGDCRGGHAKFPIFNVDVFFTQTATPPVATTAGAANAAGASSTTPAGTAAPATTSVPSSGGTTP